MEGADGAFYSLIDDTFIERLGWKEERGTCSLATMSGRRQGRLRCVTDIVEEGAEDGSLIWFGSLGKAPGFSVVQSAVRRKQQPEPMAPADVILQVPPNKRPQEP